MHTPYYVITDDRIIMNNGLKKGEVRFADVDSFFLTNDPTVKIIGIRYKKDVSGSQKNLSAEDLTMKPKVLCNLLNERVQGLHAKQE